ncbi:TRM11 family SAM-dependent methyltransferase [Ancylobacter rudongensis]|uniref:Site-specific DNA-methyltransferase (Cytosine-N4-specific) n=1 Tax=Ancylobacter rudongensis TaxID=177413 RepID=A0A1G4UTY6_9HYPH|nr:DNA methyltransferase [Ancylobacter rudongensis]SCW97004.1 site-specific DNA-methyltransferase (cytosine-N4-specific) [Ancylobacter rudongensis]
MSHLQWHDYGYFPYERELAKREVRALLGVEYCEASDTTVRLPSPIDATAARRLTYFSKVIGAGGAADTTQALLESAVRSGRSRQATRYSVHGLHEYKGKFNPQIAKAILNIFGVGAGSRVLDPFCGSGTTLVECTQLGAVGVGTDMNPLAVLLANAKLTCLATPVSVLREDFDRLSARLVRLRNPGLAKPETERDEYLRSWFEHGQLAWIEAVRLAIEVACPDRKNVFLAIASNLLRDYSDQDPNDLRIRRRSSPLPDIGFREAFESATARYLDRIEAAQHVLGVGDTTSRAIVSNARSIDGNAAGYPFDAVITSPPYATALPYIDTQRLSLVWLNLCAPSGIGPLDARLIGSREMKTKERRGLTEELHANALELPVAQLRFCHELEAAVGSTDGFRRKAVPTLIYRYMAQMRDTFASVRKVVRNDAPYALIVGHNHTVLSGVRRDVDTPSHLAALAESVGWTIEEAIPLQTYHRFGLHAVNAVGAETLVILRNR